MIQSNFFPTHSYMIFQWKAFQVWHQDSWFFIPPPLQVIQLLFFNYSLKLKSFLIAVTFAMVADTS
jgi:hypothetical protein